MKILMVTMGLGIGGAETHIVELAKELKHQGHDLAIVSRGGVYVPEITAAGIRHYEAPLNRRSMGDMRKAKVLLRQAIEQEQPDVVHAHARIPAFLCGQLQKKMGFPFVTTAHWVFNAKGVLRYLTNWGQRTVAVSDDIKAYLIREYHLPEEHISVTINGIDTEKFSPDVSGENVIREFGLDPDRPIVSYVSRMDEDRALVARQMIQIAPELDRAVPGVQLLIAGGGNVFDELHVQAEQVNTQLGRPCITMTGARTDINEIVAAGQVFVGVSRAALEAMSAGKPVIVAGNEGYHGLFGPEKLEEAQQRNFCCRGLPLSDPETLLTDLTQTLMLPSEKKAELGAYGRQVIFDFYSVRRMAGDCLAMYEQVRKKKYQVVMSGYYGFSNEGDDAILRAIQQSITQASDEIHLAVLSNDPEETQKQYGVEAAPRMSWRSVRKVLKRSDVLLSGGGSLMQDRTSTRSLLYYLAIMRQAHLLGKPVMLYANGIGPVDRAMNRSRVRKAVEKADLVTLRDENSARELKNMGVTRNDLHVTADPVFNLQPASPERAEELLHAAGLEADRDILVVSVRNGVKKDCFPEQMAQVLDTLRKSHQMEVLFLLMQPEQDLAITQRVRQAMKEPSYLLEAACMPTELMAVLGKSKLCLAMRLHALIFAARMAVPTVGLPYDPKVSSCLEELELPSAGDLEQLDVEKTIRLCDDLLTDWDGVKSRLEKKTAELSAAARQNEQLLLDLLERISCER